MGRSRKKPVYTIVHAEILGSVSKDRVLEMGSDPDENLLDELQCPLADEVIIALRKAFSLTFPRNPFIDGLQEALREIRRVGVEALRTIPEVIEGLQLKPVPPESSETANTKAYVLMFNFVRLSDLQVTVKYQGKKHKLLSLIENRPADELVRALRDAVSATFEEMHSDDQHEEVLRRIRSQIGAVLPSFNDVLMEIEVEPIADWPLLSKRVSTDDEDQESDSSKSVGSTPPSGK